MDIQGRLGSVAEGWERYREMVAILGGPVELQRQAFWAGAAVVMDILMQLQDLGDADQDAAVMQLVEEIDRFRQEVFTAAAEITQRHFGGVS